MQKILLLAVISAMATLPAHADDKLGSTKSDTTAQTDRAGSDKDAFAVADALVERDKFDEAIAAYKDALTKDPLSALGHEKLAEVYLHKGNATAAEAEDKAAIRLDSKDADAYQHLGLIAGMQKNFAAAISYEKTAISLNPKCTDAYAVLGKALSSKGNYPEAITALHKAIELDPGDFDSHLTLGAVYGRTSQYDEAVKVYKQAVALNPKSWMAHMGLGQAYEHLGDNPSQIAELKLAVQLGEHDASAHGHLGSALSKSGDIQGALAEGVIANQLRFGSYWPSALNKFLLVWACVFLVFGLIFAVMFAGSVFKPQDGERIVKSFFLVFYKERPGRFIITSRRFLYLPEAFSRWFGSTRVSIERDLIAKVSLTKTANGGVLEIDTADGSQLSFKMAQLIYAPLSRELDKLGYLGDFGGQTLHMNTKQVQQ
jgi:tetratricopeptide (TPR) repeat protein